MGLKGSKQNKITHFFVIKFINMYNDNFIKKIVWVYGYFAH
jgi:hypothetical protein